METKEIEKKILDTCIEIGKRGFGALIVLGGSPNYTPLVNQDRAGFSIKDDLFELYAKEDGAMIVDEYGIVIAYRVRINNTDAVIQDKGTRHAAGISASLSGATAFVVSEEDRKLRVFKNGQKALEVYTLEKGIEKQSSEITDLLESAGVGALGVIGGTALGVVGIAMLPGVVVFGGMYWAMKKLINKTEYEK